MTSGFVSGLGLASMRGVHGLNFEKLIVQGVVIAQGNLPSADRSRGLEKCHRWPLYPLVVGRYNARL